MKNFALALFALTIMMVAGCKGGASDPVGKWTGSVDTSSIPANTPGAEMAKQMMSKIPLELKADKTFVMTMMFPIEGTWSQSGSTITMKISKIMGQDMETVKKAAQAQGQKMDDADKPMVMTLSDDGKTLTGAAPGAKEQIKFTRDAS